MQEKCNVLCKSLITFNIHYILRTIKIKTFRQNNEHFTTHRLPKGQKKTHSFITLYQNP